MKRLLISVVVLLFLSGCAAGGIQLKSGAGEIAAGSTAITAGYLIGKNNPEKVPDWNQWVGDLLAMEPGESVISFETLLVKGFDYFIDEPFLELQFNKLIGLLEFPDLQPPDAAFLKPQYLDYVKRILRDFRDGLEAGRLEAGS